MSYCSSPTIPPYYASSQSRLMAPQ
uniref:Uncharacterized protein n=1 Tax=Anguilla anguilla TaxID=7936 RepID=A0A0E9XSY3_ANGAN